MINIEFDRYAIERTMKSYSNDLLSAFHSPTEADNSTKKNAIARAQSMLADMEYLNKIAEEIKNQVSDSQKRMAKNA